MRGIDFPNEMNVDSEVGDSEDVLVKGGDEVMEVESNVVPVVRILVCSVNGKLSMENAPSEQSSDKTPSEQKAMTLIK